ncbi:hypothetical protein [Actinotalea sp. K2]|uniref:MFS transporter small subunit n=1 Tax=Actinotalea sp. K2 TaxID=2939438 RepID=UPI00201803D7|nr:hypothetical protein [Actinotalea sp. K2]MCL3861363.1 hypothetical protein [Actinotalea sp. K2]
MAPSLKTEAAQPGPVTPAAPAGVVIRGMAMGLWLVVGTLLGYGVLQTALKATALFGG